MAQDENDLFAWAAARSTESAAEIPAETPVPAPVSAPVPDPVPAAPRLRPEMLRQAALAFLTAQNPDAAALTVPVRRYKYQVAAAALWLDTGAKNKCCRKTAIVEVYDRRDRCFANCAERSKLLDAISRLRQDRAALEAEIRAAEPHLADTDDLFSEYRTWHYEKSANPRYRKLMQQMERLQHAIYRGSRLEHIRCANAADLLYLAVPEGELLPDECAAGWGLIYVYADGSLKLIRSAEPQKCTDAGRQLLAWNIAAAAMSDVLFSHGISRHGGRYIRIARPPRRRRKWNGLELEIQPDTEN